MNPATNTFNRQQALADGYTPEQINAYLTTRKQQGVNLVDASPQPAAVQQPVENKGNGFLDLLPLLGAVGGSFIPGLGNIVGGAVGAGAGALAKNLFDKKEGVDVGEVGKEALLGGAGGVVGKGLGFVGGKALDAFGSKLGDLAEGLGIKGLRLNKSQINNFRNKHGEHPAQFLTSETALGKDATQIMNDHINPLQEQFNAIAKNSGLTASPEIFQNNVKSAVDALLEAGGTENENIAHKLMNEALYVQQNNLSPNGFAISAVDNMRRTFAGKVKNWNDPERDSLNFLMADALRKTAIDTADQAGAQGVGGLGLKDIGIKLSKYRDLENIVRTQEPLGAGNLPLGITKYLSLAAGGGILGGAPGAAMGLATNAIVNSPKFLRFASKNTMKGADALTGRAEPTTAQTILGRGAAQGAVRAPFGSDQNNTIEGQIVPQAQASGSELGTTPGTGQQDQVRKVLGALMLSKAKTGAELMAAYTFLNPNSQTKPLTATQQQAKANADSGLRALDLVQNTLAKDSFAPLKSRIPIVSQQTPYAAASREIADVLTRLRTGAALNESEVKFYRSQTPEPFDSPETIAYKLSLFRNLFDSIAHNQTPAGPEATPVMQ